MDSRPNTQVQKNIPHDNTEIPSVLKRSVTSSSATYVDCMSEATIQSLPSELLVEILSMLSVRDVVAFGSTCHAFRQLTLMQWTWRRLFRRQSWDWRLRNIKIIVKVLKFFMSRREKEEK